MSNEEAIPLTSSEIGYLWTGYSINEMSTWFMKVFCDQSKDREVKHIYQFVLEKTHVMLSERKQLLKDDGYLTPIGFSETDIHLDSPRLFSDQFLLHYLHIGAQLGLEFHSRALAIATRKDVRKYFSKCIHISTQIHERVIQLLLEKGLYWRTPSIPAPTSPEWIQKTSYLNGWIGDIRPLNSMELANLYLIVNLLNMIETLPTGFAQTSNSEDVVEIIMKGVSTAKKQYEGLFEILEKNDLPIPGGFSAEVTDVRKEVFSERIMLSHIAGLFGSLISEYGFALGAVMNHDLLAAYSAHISKAGTYSEKITRFLIEREWLEKVPGAVSRKDL